MISSTKSSNARNTWYRPVISILPRHVGITLKEIDTVEGDPERVKNGLKLTREVIGEVYRQDKRGQDRMALSWSLWQEA